MTTTGRDTAQPETPPADDVPPLDRGFTGMLGLRVVELGPDKAVLRWTVGPQLHQPYGILHGGVYCSAIETAASYGAALWYGERGNVVGVSNQTDFLRAVRDGELTATATPLHRGRLQQLWQVEIHDDGGRLVARGQVRLQNVENAARLGRTEAPTDR
jgi:uncharacterized protein (TIGR00369 family)